MRHGELLPLRSYGLLSIPGTYDHPRTTASLPHVANEALFNLARPHPNAQFITLATCFRAHAHRQRQVSCGRYGSQKARRNRSGFLDSRIAWHGPRPALPRLAGRDPLVAGTRGPIRSATVGSEASWSVLGPQPASKRRQQQAQAVSRRSQESQVARPAASWPRLEEVGELEFELPDPGLPRVVRALCHDAVATGDGPHLCTALAPLTCKTVQPEPAWQARDRRLGRSNI